MAVAQESPRSARSERTRASIADALLSLLEEGDLHPTANRIAERAGISLRLIYHHFGDLEALFREASQREMTRLLTRVKSVPADLPLPDRIDAFVEQRCRLLEWLTPVRRAASLHEPFSPALQEARDAGAKLGEREVAVLFAKELDAFPAGQRQEVADAIALSTGWNAWNGLRLTGRSEEEARRAVHRTVTRLLTQP